jgi:hypothetical protein
MIPRRRQDGKVNKVFLEIQDWKKTLGFLELEIIVHKHRLAAAIKNKNPQDSEFLELAEQFQTRFIQQDEALRLMRCDIVIFEKLTGKYRPGLQPVPKGIGDPRKKLRKEVAVIETNFKKLKAQFMAWLKTLDDMPC